MTFHALQSSTLCTLFLTLVSLGACLGTAHGQTPPGENAVQLDLDNQPVAWNIYTEGKPTYTSGAASGPAFDGSSFRCSITGGEPFSNIHCFRNLPPDTSVGAFTLGLSFWLAPSTTCNNAGRMPSVVQAIEFSAGKWERERRYELALQWQNVGPGAPQWRYWDPSRPKTRQWVSMKPKLSQCLEGNRWHKFILAGRIEGSDVLYQHFSIDDHLYPLDLRIPSVAAPGEPDKLAVAFQLDGSARQLPYDVYVDQVHLLAQSEPFGGERCVVAQLDLAQDAPLERNARVSWSPAGCIMVLQAYQDGRLLHENAQALSGTISLNDMQPGRTEVKIWALGATQPADWKYVDLR